MNPDKAKSAGVAGVAVGILSAVPILYYCCAPWGLLGGVLAVWLYSRSGGGRAVPPGEGAVLGAIAAVVASVVFFALWAPIMLLIYSEETFQETLQALGQSSPVGRIPLVLGTGAVSAVIVFAATTAGGVLGAALLKPKGGSDGAPPAAPAAPYGAVDGAAGDGPSS